MSLVCRLSGVFFMSKEEKDSKDIDNVPEVEEVPIETQAVSSQTSKRKQRSNIALTPLQPRVNIPTNAIVPPTIHVDMKTSTISPISSNKFLV